MQITLDKPRVINGQLYEAGTVVEVDVKEGESLTEAIDIDMEQKFVDSVEEVSGGFILSEGGLESDFDKYLTCVDIPRPKKVAKALDAEFTGEEFIEDVLSEIDPEAYDLWTSQSDDPYDLFRISDWLEENGSDWIDRGMDNTYNWAYLGPFTLDFCMAEYNGTYYTFFKVHLGGDPRGNYHDTYYVHKSNYESEFLENLMGTAWVNFTFKDGSEWQFYSQQDSDVWNFEFENERMLDGMAEEFYPFFEEMEQKEGGVDYAIEELWGLVE